jgi:hypothetical protein
MIKNNIRRYKNFKRRKKRGKSLIGLKMILKVREDGAI